MSAAIASGVTLGHVGTVGTIPANYPRVTALDGRFVKQIATSGTAPGATGGASSHGTDHSFPAHQHPGNDHSHSSWPAFAAKMGDLFLASSSGFEHSWDNHGHNVATVSASSATTSGSGGPGNYSAATTEPASLAVIFIASDGTRGIPPDAIFFFPGAAPAGTTAYANASNRFWKGATAAGDGGGTADTSSHTHTSPSHDHSQPAHTNTITSGNSTATQSHDSGSNHGTLTAHTHNYVSTSAGAATSATTAPTSGAGDVTPPWYKLLTVQNTSATDLIPQNNMIAIWTGALGSIPAGWFLCDGTNSTPNLSQGKYIRGANGSGEVGNTGGSATHTHPDGGSHVHSASATTHSHDGPATSSSTGPTGSVTTGANVRDDDAHVHTTTGSTTAVAPGSLTATSPGVSGANSSNDPLFTGVAYIQFHNVPPNAPTLVVPATARSFDGTGSITLKATVTDDDADDVYAVFEWQKDGGTWNVFGNGSTVASGGSSERTEPLLAFGASASYKVRAKAVDPLGMESGYTTSGNFTIHRPSLLSMIPA